MPRPGIPDPSLMAKDQTTKLCFCLPVESCWVTINIGIYMYKKKIYIDFIWRVNGKAPLLIEMPKTKSHIWLDPDVYHRYLQGVFKPFSHDGEIGSVQTVGIFLRKSLAFLLPLKLTSLGTKILENTTVETSIWKRTGKHVFFLADKILGSWSNRKIRLQQLPVCYTGVCH